MTELLLQDLALDAEPYPLDDLVASLITSHPEWGVDDPLEKSEIWAPVVGQILRTHWEQSLQQGKQPQFAFNSSSEYMIQGPCFIEPIDSPEVKAQKRNRLRWQEYYGVLRELSPREFEVLCSKILGLLGVPTPECTPYQGDQGIDFYGRMSFGDFTGYGAIFPIFETRLVLWLVGQAKHYKDAKVATPDIRELVGSVVLGRSGVFAKRDMYPSLQIRMCDPVIMLFFATGRISADGWSLCNRSGVAAMDGEMLAAFLADKGIAVCDDSEERVFNRELFDVWLAE